MASSLSLSLSSPIPTSSVNMSLDFVTSTATPVLRDNRILKDVTNQVAITPRGAPATLNQKDTGCKTRERRDLKGGPLNLVDLD